MAKSRSQPVNLPGARPLMNPLHSLQKSTLSIRDEEFTCSSFSDLLARHNGHVSKSDRTTPFGYTVLDLHLASDNRKRVFSRLLTHEGYPRWPRRIKKDDA